MLIGQFRLVAQHVIELVQVTACIAQLEEGRWGGRRLTITKNTITYNHLTLTIRFDGSGRPPSVSACICSWFATSD